MKKSILILVVLLSFIFCNAQTSFENIFLAALNKYRLGKGLVKVNYDTLTSLVAKHHSIYLDKCNLVNHMVHDDLDGGHDEKFVVPKFVRKTIDQRLAELKGKRFIGEICYQAFEIKSGTDEKLIASAIIKGFDRSKGHKAIMSFNYPNNPRIKPIVGICILKRKSFMPDHETYVITVDFGFIDLLSNR